jgi:hypothetical protein
VLDIHQQVGAEEIPGRRVAEVVPKTELRRRRPQDEGQDDQADRQAGIDPDRPFDQEPGQRAGPLEALGDQVAADHEEHEHADDAQHRLAVGQHHQRLVVLPPRR